MTKKEIVEEITRIFHDTPGNTLIKETEDGIMTTQDAIYDEPIVGFGAAKDPLFEEYKKDGVIGPWFDTPEEWLQEAKTVISIFFPFSKVVRESNRKADNIPSIEWLQGRIEGQAFIAAFTKNFEAWIHSVDIQTICPSISPEFLAYKGGDVSEKYPEYKGQKVYGSNWSERHAAFVCGLGTFGLSKGLITKKGIAGRFTSAITSFDVEADERPYTDIYEYCTRCGACIRRCPANAITMEHGKEHLPCQQFLGYTIATYPPRYGCGKCQTAVPCEDRIPGRR